MSSLVKTEFMGIWNLFLDTYFPQQVEEIKTGSLAATFIIARVYLDKVVVMLFSPSPSQPAKKIVSENKESDSSSLSDMSAGKYDVSSPSRKVGEFLLGSEVGASPVKSITHYLARKDETDEFYVLKVYSMLEANGKESVDELQGKNLLFTEHSVTSILKDVEGVVQNYGLFKTAWDETHRDDKGGIMTKKMTKLCLALGCYEPHNFSPKYGQITNMHYHMSKEKKLEEAQAIQLFYKVTQIIERVHKLNIVHRDLKLGNFILDKSTGELTLVNFNLSLYLCKDTDLIADQRGTPAYISPELLSGKPYLGKPSDMWSLGIVLYTMLYGQFPFYDKNTPELFSKVKAGEFVIPLNISVSKETVQLIRSLLILDPTKRLTASQAVKEVKEIITKAYKSQITELSAQAVPDCPPVVCRPTKRSGNVTFAPLLVVPATGIPSYTPTNNVVDFMLNVDLAERILANPMIEIPGVYTPLSSDDIQEIFESIFSQNTNHDES